MPSKSRLLGLDFLTSPVLYFLFLNFIFIFVFIFIFIWIESFNGTLRIDFTFRIHSYLKIIEFRLRAQSKSNKETLFICCLWFVMIDNRAELHYLLIRHKQIVHLN